MEVGGERDVLAELGPSPRSTLRLCSRLGGSSKGGCSICDRVSGPAPGMDSGSRGAECKAGSGFGSGSRCKLGMPRCRIGRHPDASIVLIVEDAQEIANKGEQDGQSGLTF